MGVAVGEDALLVPDHHMLKTETLGLIVIELAAKRHQLLAHLLAEGGDLLLTVVRAALLHIGQRDEVLIAEVAPHLVAHGDQLVPDCLHARLVGLVEVGIGLPRAAARFAVVVLEMLLDAVEVAGLAVKFNAARGHELLVFHDQLVFALGKGNVLLAEALLLQLDLREELAAEFLLQLLAEGRVEQRLVAGNAVLLQLGQRVVQIFQLFFIEFVCRVERVADKGDGALLVKGHGRPVDLEQDAAHLGIILRVFHLLRPCLIAPLGLLHVGALIGDGGKSPVFHSRVSFAVNFFLYHTANTGRIQAGFSVCFLCGDGLY